MLLDHPLLIYPLPCCANSLRNDNHNADPDKRGGGGGAGVFRMRSAVNTILQRPILFWHGVGGNVTLSAIFCRRFASGGTSAPQMTSALTAHNFCHIMHGQSEV